MTPEEGKINRRNIIALKGFLKELTDLAAEASYVRCPCGYDMLEIPIHEVVEIYVCPNCRRVTEGDPDKETVIYKGQRSP